MRVMLISANTETINMPTLPIGLGCVAAALQKKEHEVEFLDLMTEDAPQDYLRKTIGYFEPNVIGISIRNIDDQNSAAPQFLLEKAKPLVSLCKKLSKAPVVLGGAGYSIFPENALDYLDADMGIQGEGESAFPMLLERLESGAKVSDIPGLYIKRQGLQAERAYRKKLDELPLPDPALFDLSVAQNSAYYLPVQTRRGCPLRCSYCSTSTIEGSLIRKRSPENVVRELARWRAAGFTKIFFVDNIFNLPESYALELCRRIEAAGLDIEWRCILYPGGVTETLVKNMALAGCREVSLGFESGQQDMLDSFHKRFSLKDIRRAAQILAEHGVVRMGFLMFGGPGETRASVENSLDFAESLKLEAMKITVGIRIYPYTDLAKIALKAGAIGPDTNLLFPHFYIEKGLEDWLRSTVAVRIANRPNWML